MDVFSISMLALNQVISNIALLAFAPVTATRRSTVSM